MFWGYHNFRNPPCFCLFFALQHIIQYLYLQGWRRLAWSELSSMGLGCRGAWPARNSSFKWLVVCVQRKELLLIRNGWIPLDTRGATTGDNWNVLSFHINWWTLFVNESIMVIRCWDWDIEEGSFLSLVILCQYHLQNRSFQVKMASTKSRWMRREKDNCWADIYESATESCPTKMTWGDVNLITFLNFS